MNIMRTCMQVSVWVLNGILIPISSWDFVLGWIKLRSPNFIWLVKLPVVWFMVLFGLGSNFIVIGFNQFYTTVTINMNMMPLAQTFNY